MSYIGDRAATSVVVPRAGVIRPGIQRLTRAAQEHPRAAEIRSIFARAEWGEIKFNEAKKLIEKSTGLVNAMHPSNAPYFSVFATDFTVPEHARMILEKYGEDRGEGKRLYRFPVVFQTTDIDRIIPGGFRRGKGEPAYFSTNGLDGVRYCAYYEHITPEQWQEQRHRKVIQVRSEAKVRGKCDPEKCKEFAEGSCRFVGDISFYIPGIAAGGLMRMTTGSEFACEAMYMELARIKEALGTIPQVHPFLPGEPTFMITKRLETRTYYNQRTGVRERAQNWVPILVPNFDMGALISTPRHLLPSAQMQAAPQAWLAAPHPNAAPVGAMYEDAGVKTATEPLAQAGTAECGDPEISEVVTPSDYPPHDDKPPMHDPADESGPLGAQPDVRTQLGYLVDLSAPDVATWIEALGGEDVALRVALSLSEMGDGIVDSHIALVGIIRSSGIPKEQFSAYMAQRYGKGWARNASVYADALANVRSMQHDGSLAQIVAAATPK
jgi:hypothetical protein